MESIKYNHQRRMINMSRRTKKEMELMKDDCRYYLIQTNNNPHQAHELMIKEYLESHQMIPYYIKGVKDFFSVSQDLALELNRKEQMKKRDREIQDSKEKVINFIMNLSKDEARNIYKEYKDTVSHSDKLVLVDVCNMKFANDFKEKYIDQHMINVFSNIIKTHQESKVS